MRIVTVILAGGLFGAGPSFASPIDFTFGAEPGTPGAIATFDLPAQPQEYGLSFFYDLTVPFVVTSPFARIPLAQLVIIEDATGHRYQLERSGFVTTTEPLVSVEIDRTYALDLVLGGETLLVLADGGAGDFRPVGSFYVDSAQFADVFASGTLRPVPEPGGLWLLGLGALGTLGLAWRR